MEIPEYSRYSERYTYYYLLGVDKGEWINAIIPIRELVTMKNSYSSQQNKVSLREHHFHHLQISVRMA